MKHLNLGVLASGGGTNLQAIIDNCQKGAIDADVGVVISNSSSSGALERSRKHGIPALHISGTKLDSDDVVDETILHALGRPQCRFGGISRIYEAYRNKGFRCL